MTDKEKEAIEEIGLIIESFYNFPNPISIDLKDKDVKFLETVLNLIQTQQAEIEKYKYLYQKALDNTIKSDRELFNKKAELEKKDKQIEQYQNMLATNDMLHVLECEKKDKVIDKLATLVFMSRNLTYVDEKQFNARKREIIEQAEKQVVEEVKRK